VQKPQEALVAGRVGRIVLGMDKMYDVIVENV